MRGLGIVLWGFVLMMLAFDSLVVPCVIYGIATVVGLYSSRKAGGGGGKGKRSNLDGV